MESQIEGGAPRRLTNVPSSPRLAGARPSRIGLTEGNEDNEEERRTSLIGLLVGGQLSGSPFCFVSFVAFCKILPDPVALAARPPPKKQRNSRVAMPATLRVAMRAGPREFPCYCFILTDANHGLGCGVGRGLGVTLGVGLGVGLGVPLGVGVGVGEGGTVGDGVGLAHGGTS